MNSAVLTAFFVFVVYMSILGGCVMIKPPRFLSRKRLEFIESYSFNEGLKAKFQASHASLTVEQQEQVFSALRDYFYLCHQAGRSMVSMPSQVVDDAWHEFLLFTKEYDEFCNRAFGRFLHHTPAEAMESQQQAQAGIRRSWRLACEKEGINPNKPDRLPLIFAIDALLNIENGFTYSLDCLANSSSSDRQIYCATHIGCGAGCSSFDGGTGWTGYTGSSDCGHVGSGHSCGGGGHSCGGGGCGGSCGGGCGGGCGGC
jgi:hypothetical protein